ncbi:cathepsin B-like isoform X2 [Acanthaster planci]|uniref:Cathepsin B-like isoform X2 n=1 Tax=Acanthaster planci TaxID=133434 RepID=A0A8B7Z948_ACAPL|nr:cathepsin B-like isoform X2 [Acanthaster planci]
MANALLYYFLIGQILLDCHGDWYPGECPPSFGQLPALLEEIVGYINNLNTTWKAGLNFQGNNQRSFVKLLLGNKLTTSTPPDRRLPMKPPSDLNPKEIPKSFDAVEKWPECLSMRRISDQGACGAGWAFGALEAMSDRYCIFSKMKNLNVTLSAENLISCCGLQCGFGCEGGYPSAAWHYWVQAGIVTGGGFESSQGCQPYTFQPCRHVSEGSAEEDSAPTCAPMVQTPECQTECRKGYNKSYSEDLHFGKSAYAVMNNVLQIEEEIMHFGPVEASMDIFEDFLSYKSGVYQHVIGKFINKHSVKLYGWGVTSDGVKYWQAANSWNENWGFFRILQGADECGIEEDVYAGVPLL